MVVALHRRTSSSCVLGPQATAVSSQQRSMQTLAQVNAFTTTCT